MDEDDIEQKSKRMRYTEGLIKSVVVEKVNPKRKKTRERKQMEKKRQKEERDKVKRKKRNKNKVVSESLSSSISKQSSVDPKSISFKLEPSVKFSVPLPSEVIIEQQKAMISIEKDAKNKAVVNSKSERRKAAFEKITKKSVDMLTDTKLKMPKKKTVLEKMESNSTKSGPMRVLYDSVKEGHKIKVWIRRYNGLRGVVSGYLIAFDFHMNLAMIDVCETYTIETWMVGQPVQRKKKKKDVSRSVISTCNYASALNFDKKSVENVSIQNSSSTTIFFKALTEKLKSSSVSNSVVKSNLVSEKNTSNGTCFLNDTGIELPNQKFISDEKQEIIVSSSKNVNAAETVSSPCVSLKDFSPTLWSILQSVPSKENENSGQPPAIEESISDSSYSLVNSMLELLKKKAKIPINTEITHTSLTTSERRSFFDAPNKRLKNEPLVDSTKKIVKHPIEISSDYSASFSLLTGNSDRLSLSYPNLVSDIVSPATPDLNAFESFSYHNLIENNKSECILYDKDFMVTKDDCCKTNRNLNLTMLNEKFTHAESKADLEHAKIKSPTEKMCLLKPQDLAAVNLYTDLHPQDLAVVQPIKVRPIDPRIRRVENIAVSPTITKVFVSDPKMNSIISNPTSLLVNKKRSDSSISKSDLKFKKSSEKMCLEERKNINFQNEKYIYSRAASFDTVDTVIDSDDNKSEINEILWEVNSINPFKSQRHALDQGSFCSEELNLVVKGTLFQKEPNMVLKNESSKGLSSIKSGDPVKMEFIQTGKLQNESIIDQSNIDQSSIDQSNIDQSSIDQSSTDQSSIDQVKRIKMFDEASVSTISSQKTFETYSNSNSSLQDTQYNNCRFIFYSIGKKLNNKTVKNQDIRNRLENKIVTSFAKITPWFGVDNLKNESDDEIEGSCCLSGDLKKGKVTCNLPDSLKDSLPDSLKDFLPDSLKDSLPDSLNNSLPDSLKDSLPDSLKDSLPDSLKDSLPDSLKDYLPDSLKDSLPDSLKLEIDSNLTGSSNKEPIYILTDSLKHGVSLSDTLSDNNKSFDVVTLPELNLTNVHIPSHTQTVVSRHCFLDDLKLDIDKSDLTDCLKKHQDQYSDLHTKNETNIDNNPNVDTNTEIVSDLIKFLLDKVCQNHFYKKNIFCMASNKAYNDNKLKLNSNLICSVDDAVICESCNEKTENNILKEVSLLNKFKVQSGDEFKIQPRSKLMVQSSNVLKIQPGTEFMIQAGNVKENISLNNEQMEPINEFDKQMEPISELHKQMEPIAELDKQSEPISELNKQMEPISELDKQMEPNSELDKQMKPISELNKQENKHEIIVDYNKNEQNSEFSNLINPACIKKYESRISNVKDNAIQSNPLKMIFNNTVGSSTYDSLVCEFEETKEDGELSDSEDDDTHDEDDGALLSEIELKKDKNKTFELIEKIKRKTKHHQEEKLMRKTKSRQEEKIERKAKSHQEGQTSGTKSEKLPCDSSSDISSCDKSLELFSFYKTSETLSHKKSRDKINKNQLSSKEQTKDFSCHKKKIDKKLKDESSIKKKLDKKLKGESTNYEKSVRKSSGESTGYEISDRKSSCESLDKKLKTKNIIHEKLILKSYVESSEKLDTKSGRKSSCEQSSYAKSDRKSKAESSIGSHKKSSFQPSDRLKYESCRYEKSDESSCKESNYEKSNDKLSCKRNSITKSGRNSNCESSDYEKSERNSNFKSLSQKSSSYERLHKKSCQEGILEKLKKSKRESYEKLEIKSKDERSSIKKLKNKSKDELCSYEKSENKSKGERSSCELFENKSKGERSSSERLEYKSKSKRSSCERSDSRSKYESRSYELLENKSKSEHSTYKKSDNKSKGERSSSERLEYNSKGERSSCERLDDKSKCKNRSYAFSENKSKSEHSSYKKSDNKSKGERSTWEMLGEKSKGERSSCERLENKLNDEHSSYNKSENKSKGEHSSYKESNNQLKGERCSYNKSDNKLKGEGSSYNESENKSKGKRSSYNESENKSNSKRSSYNELENKSKIERNSYYESENKSKSEHSSYERLKNKLKDERSSSELLENKSKSERTSCTKSDNNSKFERSSCARWDSKSKSERSSCERLENISKGEHSSYKKSDNTKDSFYELLENKSKSEHSSYKKSDNKSKGERSSCQSMENKSKEENVFEKSASKLKSEISNPQKLDNQRLKGELKNERNKTTYKKTSPENTSQYTTDFLLSSPLLPTVEIEIKTDSEKDSIYTQNQSDYILMEKTNSISTNKISQQDINSKNELNVFQKRNREKTIQIKRKRDEQDELTIDLIKNDPNKKVNSSVLPKKKPSLTHTKQLLKEGGFLERRSQHNLELKEKVRNENLLKSLQPTTFIPKNPKVGLIYKKRYVNQLFVRGDNIIMVAYDKSI